MQELQYGRPSSARTYGVRFLMSAPKSIEQTSLFDVWRRLPGAGSLLVFEFVQTLVALDAGAHGFSPRDIAEVEAAWGYVDADFYWIGGFVVRLRDGRRAYIHSFCDADTLQYAATVRVEMLAEGQPYYGVATSRPPGNRPIPWEVAPERLNEFLRQLPGES